MGTWARVGAAVAAPFPDAEALVASMANPESGIRFVLGIARKAGKRASEVQSVIFDKLKWTADTAKVWLRDHGFTIPKVDEGATFWRFRQQDPKRYKEFRTVVPGTRQNPRGPLLSHQVLNEHIRMPGIPQLIVERGFAHQWWGGGRWGGPKHGIGSLDHAVYAAKAVSDPLTDIDARNEMLATLGESLKEGNPKLQFGRTPYDLKPDEIGRYHVVNDGGYIVAKQGYEFSAIAAARDASEKDTTGTFQVIDTRDGSIVARLYEGEDLPEEENPGRPWPKVYKTRKAAEEAWYDSAPGVNDHATYIKVRGGYRVVPEGRLGGQGHYGTTVDDMERGDTGFENPQDSTYRVRFIRPDQAGELVNLYHTARTALSGQASGRYERMLYASKWFHKEHPEVSETAAYKDLDGLLSNWFGARNPATVKQLYVVQHLAEVDGESYTGKYPASSTTMSRGFQKMLRDHRAELLDETGKLTARDRESYKQVYYQTFRQADYRSHKGMMPASSLRTPGAGASSNPDYAGQWTNHEDAKPPFYVQVKDKGRWRAMYGGEGIYPSAREASRAMVAHAGEYAGKFAWRALDGDGKIFDELKARPASNPTPGEAISAYDEHLATTLDPTFAAATPDEQAAAMTVQDALENPMPLRDLLAHVVTEYDRKQEGKRGYNMYALPQYLNGVSDVMEEVGKGYSVRSAITNTFTGRLADVLLRAVKESPTTREEQMGPMFKEKRNPYQGKIAVTNGDETVVLYTRGDGRHAFSADGEPFEYDGSVWLDATGARWKQTRLSRNPAPGYSDAAPDVKAHIESHPGTWFSYLAYPGKTLHKGDYDTIYAAAKEAAVHDNRPIYFGSYLTGREPARMTGSAMAVWPDGHITWASEVPLRKANPDWWTEKKEKEYGGKFSTPVIHIWKSWKGGAGGPGREFWVFTIEQHVEGLVGRSIGSYQHVTEREFKTPQDAKEFALSVIGSPDYHVHNWQKAKVQVHRKHWDPAGDILQANPSDLGQAAFDAAKDFRLSGAYHETGVANARVAGYGFSKWYNNLTRPQLKGHRKATLKKNWMEGWAAGKRVEKKQGNPSTSGTSAYRAGYDAYLSGKPVGHAASDYVRAHVAKDSQWYEKEHTRQEFHQGWSAASIEKKDNPYYGPYTGFVVYNVENGVKVGTFRTQEEAQHWIDSYGASQEYKERYYRIKSAEEFYAGTRYGERNPESPAQALYEDFHGRPSAETLEITTERQQHEWLTGLGTLVELKVATITQLDASISFAKDKQAPELCSSEDGRQLYIEGGDQALDLKALKMAGDKWEKDSMVIGVLYELTYQTEKKFHKFKLTDYFHKLGEETGVQPTLLYDPTNRLLSISGGQYQVKDVGIVN
jgi:hypothetical protein